MVALQHQGAESFLVVLPLRRPGRSRQFHVLVDDLAVEGHLDKTGVAHFPARGIETGRAENDVKALPLAGRSAGVHARRMPLKLAPRLGPARVDAAALDPRILVLRDPVAVIHLDLVAALEVDAGVRAL